MSFYFPLLPAEGKISPLVSKYAQPLLLKSHPWKAGNMSPFCPHFQLTKNLRTISMLEDKMSYAKRCNVSAQIQNDPGTVSYFLSAWGLVMPGLGTGAHTVWLTPQWTALGRVLHLDNNSRVYELLITFTTQIIFLFLYGSPDLVKQKLEIVNLFKIIESLSAHYFQHLTGNAEQ